MSRQGWALLLSALLLLPSAAAREGSGTFDAESSFFFSTDLRARGEPLALFVPQTAPLTTLEVHVAKATVFEHRVPFLEVGAPGIDPVFFQNGQVEDRTWTVRDARLTLALGDHRGIMGLHPSEGASLALETVGGGPWESRLASTVGDAVVETTDDDPRSVAHGHHVSGPHVHGRANGSFEYLGQGALHLVGPDVEIRSSNVTKHETGSRRTGVTEKVITVLFIRFDAPATVRVEGAPFEAALAQMDASWDGPLRFVPREGRMRTEDGIYIPTGQAVVLDGDMDARIVPLSSERARVDLAGTVRASTLTFEPAPTAAPALPGWISLLVLGSVTAGAGGGAIVAWGTFRRRFQRPAPTLPFSAEDCQEAGAVACSEEDWAKGAEWFARGVALAPTSARLHADLAFCLSQIGDVERALEHYARAHALSSDGEAGFNAACAAVAAGLDAEAERWLGLALARSPEFVIHLAEDAEWEGLLATPRVDALARAAWSRLDRRDPSSPTGAGRPGA